MTKIDELWNIVTMLYDFGGIQWESFDEFAGAATVHSTGNLVLACMRPNQENPLQIVHAYMPTPKILSEVTGDQLRGGPWL